MTIRLRIGIVAPVLANAPLEKVTVTLMPIAMQVFTAAVIIVCSITRMEIAHGDHQRIVALLMVSSTHTPYTHTHKSTNTYMYYRILLESIITYTLFRGT